MAREHRSFFSYNIQRPYPLRWFTPTAIIGGIVFAALVSFANFAATGYELTTVYASDPQDVSQSYFFQRWPAWLKNNIDAKCEPANLPIASQFFTNQTGLAYNLDGISIKQKDGALLTSSSLPYINNVLEGCRVLNISMDFTCDIGQNPTQLAKRICNTDVRAYSTCSMDGPNGVTNISFSSFYNPNQGHPGPGSSDLISTNIATRASLWWAQQLLPAYWRLANDVVIYWLNESLAYDADKKILSGAANFYRHESQDEIRELDFFDVWFDFFGLTNGTYYYSRGSVKTFVEEPNSGGSDAPEIWRETDLLAKAMYSAVLTDLGRGGDLKQSNIFADTNTLHKFAKTFPASLTDTAQSIYPTEQESLIYESMVNGTYDETHTSLGAGPLEVSPSVISTMYLCSVPRMKSAGNIFMSILLADLVLLNTAWVVYCLVVERFFVQRSPEANYCEGCLKNTNELQPLRDSGFYSNRSSILRIPTLGFEPKTFPTRYEPVQMKRKESSESLADGERWPSG